VRDARKYVNVTLERTPDHERARALLGQVNDKGSTFAKLGFFAMVVAGIGVATAWRLLSRKWGSNTSSAGSL